MLVVHNRKFGMSYLPALYEGSEVRLVERFNDLEDFGELFQTVSPEECVLLVGNGSRNGLYASGFYARPEKHRFLVGLAETQLLKRHGNNLIGIWPHADRFAAKNGLHGLFSGKFITTKKDAESFGIITLQHHIDEANSEMFSRLRTLLATDIPLADIPARMNACVTIPDWIKDFNYNQFVYL